MKEISHKNNMILIQLTYSPRDSTLCRKFLSKKYCRMHIEAEEELILFDRAMRTCSFDVDREDMLGGEQPNKKKIK